MDQPKIVGSVTKDGRPLLGAYVTLAGPSGEFVSEQYTKEDGRFTFYVAPGAWTVDVRAAGVEPSSKTIDVAGGDAIAHIDLG